MNRDADALVMDNSPSRKLLATLATEPSSGGVSIVAFTGVSADAPALWRRIADNEIHYEWLKNRAGEIIDEVLITRFGECFLLTGHGGGVCALAIVETLNDFGYEVTSPVDFFSAFPAELKVDFSNWLHFFLACHNPAQLTAVARAVAENPVANFDLLNGELARFLRRRKIVIVGAANVGKSSLFNLLVGGDCAMVADFAGTTRDTVRREISIGDFFCELFDTAGWQDLSTAKDALTERSYRAGESLIDTADLIIFVSGDSVKTDTAAASAVARGLKKRSPAPALLIVNNKSDLQLPSEKFPEWLTAPAIKISCTTGCGISQLRTEIDNLLRE